MNAIVLRRFLIFALLQALLSSPLQAHDIKPLQHHCPMQAYEGKLLIDVLAVGQGDSTFIRTPSGTTILIDGGNPGRGSQDILPTIKKCFSVTSLDYVILTHPHADHFGGLIDVLKEIPVKKAVYDTGHSSGTAFARYEVLADATGRRKIPELGDKTIITGDAVQVRVVAVNGHVLGGKSVQVFKTDGSPKDKNSVSIAMVLTLGGFRYFTGGDLSGGGNNTPDVETPVADAVGLVEVMKADHHGSATANNDHLLQKLRPHHVLISVGEGEANLRYHLPNSDTMARLMKLPFIEDVYQTSRGEGGAPATVLTQVHNENGDIVVIAGPKSYSIDGHEYAHQGQ